jgi:prepilin-type N-terminal cleavage/methylation domain-containing protein
MLQLKNKVESGFTIIELLIVIAIIGILATLVLTNFQGAQARGRDTVRSSDVNSVFSKLEEYYNNNSGYPLGTAVTSAAAQTTFPGIDASALVDEDGDDVVVSYEVVATGASPTVPDATDDDEYRLHFYGPSCDASTQCAKYVLVGFQETDTNDIVKNSLN